MTLTTDGLASTPTPADGVALPLPTYAAVRAAVAEGFPLPEVLAVEAIPAPEWAAADLAWKPKIATDPAQLATYSTELAHAEDWLDRRVAPLGEDLSAWLVFLDCYAADPSPFEWLQGLKLGLNDLSRLRRSWDKRMREDKEIEQRIAQLRRRSLGPLPPVVVDAPVLRRSRGSTRAEAPPSAPHVATPPTELTAGLELDVYASICATVELGGDDQPRALSRFGIHSVADRQALDGRWRREFERDPTLARDFRSLLAHAKRRLLASKSEAPPLDPPAPAASVPSWMLPTPALGPPEPGARPNFSETVVAVDLLGSPPSDPLPFVAGSPGAAPPSSPAPPVAPGRGPRPNFSETVVAVDLLGSLPSDPLPFVAGSPGAAPPSSPAPPVAAKRSGSDFGETVPLGADILAEVRAPLPFTPQAAAMPQAAAPAAAKRSGSDFGETVPLGADILAEMRAPLPFTPQAAAMPQAAAPAAAKRSGSDFGETVPLGADILAEARAPLPFTPQTAAGPVTPQTAAGPVAAKRSASGFGETAPLGADLLAEIRDSLPFKQQAAGPPSQPSARVAASPMPPTMALDRYASFCAEIYAFPHKMREICLRYQVPDDASRRALDTHWQKQFAAQPALKAEWQRLGAVAHAWLKRKPQ